MPGKRDNQLTAKGTRNFTYDAQGNEITDATKTLGYNFDNILKTYTSGSTTTSYVYDATGNRVEKNGATNYQYVNGGNNNVMVAKNITAGSSNFYVYGNDMVSQGGPNTTDRQYYLTDGLGNVRYLTNSSGTTLNTYATDPYGGNPTGTGTTANNYTYAAEQKDSESGLTYLRARYYDPTTGRFTSQDPSPGTLDNPASQNGYNFTDNNPVNMMDPSGMSPLSTLMRISGFQKYENSIAQGCSIGSIVTNGATAVLNSSILIPGVGAVGAGAQGLSKVALAEGLARTAAASAEDAATNAASNLSEKLIFEEALTNGGSRMDMTLNDPLYQNGWDKFRYTHTALDGTKTTVHWVQQQSTGAIDQVKIKYINLSGLK